MSNAPPSTYLIWAIVACMLLAFLLYHLYSFDRFKCLRWNSGPYSGAFKRIMTYTYLVTVPLIATFAIGFTVLKYREGFVDLPPYGVIPKPYELWAPEHRRSIFPLDLAFSVAWALEMVTHLEELCFWLFLVTSQTSPNQNWFKSVYFRTWVVGSIVAVVYMPLVTIFTREDPLKSEAYTYLAGGLGSLSLTLWFTPILWNFKTFLQTLKREGVDHATIVRLTKFHELNSIRILFRFLFTVPFVILGADGIRSTPVVNRNAFAIEFLTNIAAVGCGVSSGLTLIIFFPRSIEGEIAAKESRHGLSGIGDADSIISRFEPPEMTIPEESSTTKFASYESDLPALSPNRKRGSDVEIGRIAGDRMSVINRWCTTLQVPLVSCHLHFLMFGGVEDC
ncbi:hypothetical protein BDZ89DRAFT_1209861 [Hymenopellis radicata]|nr:hypothetical protein BDZ89DRAFT_1209861 [Hymenopellis radicata]